jgi:hypothetical protein
MMISDKDKGSMESDTGFVSRWSRRKLDARKQDTEEKSNAGEQQVPLQAVQPPLTDADMPPIEKLTPDSDYSGFLSPEVSEELRKLALRKLFHGAEFNIRDGLDDYDSDYTSYTKLGDIITADMKHQMEQEARKMLASDEEEHINMTEVEGVDEELDSTSETETIAESEVDRVNNQQLAESLLDDDEADLQSEL